jgi:DNA-binding NtrC family response regulator
MFPVLCNIVKLYDMTTPRQQKKILIIDETNYTRLTLEYTLTSVGYKVTTAPGIDEAMQRISADLPDLILLSLRASDSGRMPTLRTMKDYFRLRLDIAQGAEPPIVALSASRDMRENQEVESLGISKILFKPINMQDLFDSITSAIANGKKVTSQRRKKLIVLDGEARSQQFLESILTHEMYDIETADSEAEFLARLKHRKFDLSIIDLVSLEGEVVALRSIREVADEMHIVTIACSADAISQDDLEQLGIKVHFVKPLNIDAFRTQVDKLLEEQMEEAPAEAGSESTPKEQDE